MTRPQDIHSPSLRGLLLLGALLLVPPPLTAGGAIAAQEPRTPAELSRFTQYTSYDAMMVYLEAVQARSTEMRMGVYGKSREGRELPYLVFSRPAVTQPWEAAALGKPVISLNANVHGGERTFRESLLILVRELATPGTEANAYLDDVVILVIPQKNPDGFEATERGQRGNAWGIDLNRDWIKLEHPSIADYVANILNRWTPHLFVDGHNGGSFPYHVTYQCTSHADPDQRITALCDDEIFPAIEARLAPEGYRSWYYQRGTETRWDGGGSDARIGRNYGGFANTVGILFESPPWQDMEPGVLSGILAYKAVIEYARDQGERLMETVNRARRETIEMGRAPRGEVVVQQEYGPRPGTVTYSIGREVDGVREEIQVTSDSLMLQPVPTKTRPRPWAYILPRDAEAAVAMLRRHGITVEVLRGAVELEVDAYVLEGVGYEEAYNHAAATRVQVADDPVRVTRSFPPGSYLVQTGQMMGRVVAHMLEPETNDNVIYWNTMDAWLPKAALQAGGDEPPLVPIFKIMAPVPLPMRIVE